MTTIWPWIIMGVGVVTLFAYRFLRTRRRFLYSPVDFQLGKENIEPGKVANSDRIISSMGRLPRKRSSPLSIAASRDLMPIVISILILLAALYVILSRSAYADAQQKWAFGVVGTILGYWFKR